MTSSHCRRPSATLRQRLLGSTTSVSQEDRASQARPGDRNQLNALWQQLRTDIETAMARKPAGKHQGSAPSGQYKRFSVITKQVGRLTLLLSKSISIRFILILPKFKILIQNGVGHWINQKIIIDKSLICTLYKQPALNNYGIRKRLNAFFDSNRYDIRIKMINKIFSNLLRYLFLYKHPASSEYINIWTLPPTTRWRLYHTIIHPMLSLTASNSRRCLMVTRIGPCY